MNPSASEIQDLLFSHTNEIFKDSRELRTHTKICGDLGLCDEDLWEMIDRVLDQFGLPKPSPENPAFIDVRQSDITFEILTAWIAEYAARFR